MNTGGRVGWRFSPPCRLWAISLPSGVGPPPCLPITCDQNRRLRLRDRRQGKQICNRKLYLCRHHSLATHRHYLWTFWGKVQMIPVSPVAPNPALGVQTASSAFSAPLASTDTSSHGQSVTVDLSENAKAALAAANENQDAANRILAFVDANRSDSHRADYANRNWSDGEPSLEQEYQQLVGSFSQNPNSQKPSQGDVLTITLSESTSVSLSVQSGSGAGATSASAESTQSDSVSLSVNVNSSSIQIVQSNQSQTDITA
jgi:flagellar basal body L-ring protein FlgH